MSPSTSPNKPNVSQSPPLSARAGHTAHDEWLRQRAELEKELLDADPNLDLAASQAAVTPAGLHAIAQSHATQAQHADSLQPANGAAVHQRLEQQLEQELARQRQAFQQDLICQRVAFEQELAGRETASKAQRDKEWAAIQNAKGIQEATTKKLTEELATRRVRDREDLEHWRQQAEAEMADARRLFEQERLQQRTALARQRDAELDRLRQEREEFDTHVRLAYAELESARQRHEDERRQARDAHLAQLQTERAELDKLRDTWTDKLRREHFVLENGLQFFEQNLSRVSEGLKSAQIGLQAASVSAASAVSSVSTGEVRMTLPFIHPAPTQLPHGSPSAAAAPSATPKLLSLDEIRERLLQLKEPERRKAA